MRIFSVAIYVNRLFSFAQVHQDPGCILQTPDIRDMIPMIMGNGHSIQMLQLKVVLKQ
jgi:hypothetical protein